MSAPHVAVSMHAWDPYFRNPGTGEVPTSRFLRHLDALQRLNPALSRVRLDGGWSTSQPRNEPPTMDNYYNRRIAWACTQITKRGVKPYLVIHQSPPWSRPKNSAGADPKRYPDNPAAITPWAAWAADAFGEWVSEWEAWNEPNLIAFTGSRNGGSTSYATPTFYLPMLKAISEGIHAGNPCAKVIGANLSQSDWFWLDGAYRAGLKDHCDIIGVHPYQGRQSIPPISEDTAGFTKSVTGWQKGRIAIGLPMFYEVMKKYGDADKPLWVTEQGWGADALDGVGTSGVPASWPTMGHKAASYIRQWLDLLVTGKGADGEVREVYTKVRLSTLYQLFDPLSTSAHQQGFSIITDAGELLPQAQALLDFAAKFPASRPLY